MEHLPPVSMSCTSSSQPALLGSSAWPSLLLLCRPPADKAFSQVLVPTVDTVRMRFITSALVKSNVHTLVVGGELRIHEVHLSQVP